MTAPAAAPVLAAGAAVLAVVLLVLAAGAGRTPVQRRLDSLRRFAVQRPARSGWRPAALAAADRAGTVLARLARRPPGGRDALDAAALPLTPAQWLGVRAAAVPAGAALLAVPLPWWLGVPAGAVAGAVLPGALLRVRADRRRRAFAKDLPDTLHLVVGSLRAGFTLQHAVASAARDADGPVAAELRRALSETRLGGALIDALERIGERTGSADVRWVVLAVRLQAEVGGTLSEVLETAAETMREREALRRGVRALTAEGRLSATVLTVLPLVLSAWLFLFRRDYVAPLLTEPLGVVLLGAAAVLLVTGIAWLRAVVRVEA